MNIHEYLKYLYPQIANEGCVKRLKSITLEIDKFKANLP